MHQLGKTWDLAVWKLKNVLFCVSIYKWWIKLYFCGFNVDFSVTSLQVVPLQRCRYWHHEQGRRHAPHPRSSRYTGVGCTADQQEAAKGNNQSHASDGKNHLQVGVGPLNGAFSSKHFFLFLSDNQLLILFFTTFLFQWRCTGLWERTHPLCERSGWWRLPLRLQICFRKLWNFSNEHRPQHYTLAGKNCKSGSRFDFTFLLKHRQAHRAVWSA